MKRAVIVGAVQCQPSHTAATKWQLEKEAQLVSKILILRTKGVHMLLKIVGWNGIEFVQDRKLLRLLLFVVCLVAVFCVFLL